jgi:hypothetical protein
LTKINTPPPFTGNLDIAHSSDLIGTESAIRQGIITGAESAIIPKSKVTLDFKV